MMGKLQTKEITMIYMLSRKHSTNFVIMKGKWYDTLFYNHPVI